MHEVGLLEDTSRVNQLQSVDWYLYIVCIISIVIIIRNYDDDILYFPTIIRPFCSSFPGRTKSFLRLPPS